MNSRIRMTAAAVMGLVALTGCSLIGSSGEEATDATAGPTGSSGTVGGEVVLLTHDSWAMPKKLVKAFEADTGYDLTIRSSGDAGTLTNRLVLTKGDPEGDVAFGVDNTFASRALDEGVFAEVDRTQPPGAAGFVLPDDEGSRLAPIDVGDVCVNIDKDWFAAEGIDPPRTLDDLTDPAYENLLVTPAATTSSTGMAFLLATIGEYGDGWADYWSDLIHNGAKVTDGWSDAYYVDFTAAAEKGTRPIVVSYDSSPAFTLTDDGRESTTEALLDTCFQQVEYAGVLAGAQDPTGAEAVVQWLQSPEVQAALPTQMYVFPVRDDVTLPDDWARFAVRPDSTLHVAPADIAANRDAWLVEWQDVATR